MATGVLQLQLEDFFPGYPDFDTSYTDDALFQIYDDSTPESIYYRKKEFYTNQLGPQEVRPIGVGSPLQHQTNISRFLSQHSLNDELLLFDAVGTGKCVHPSTVITVNRVPMTIESAYNSYRGTKNDIYDNIGVWSSPRIKICTDSVNLPAHKICVSEIKYFYRQQVHEPLVYITLVDGCVLSCTQIHRLLHRDKSSQAIEWIESGKLQSGAYVYTQSGGRLVETQIKSIVHRVYKGWVYDLEIETHHNYICSGIVTHNTCSAVTIAEDARRANPHLKPCLVLVKGPALKRNFTRELAFKCTGGRFVPENYENLTRGEQVLRTNRLVNSEYDIHTFETFAASVAHMSVENINRIYSNRVIIIDEIHNIKIQPKKKNPLSVNVYDSIHRFLHNLTNRKIVLMSATPMRDRPDEFASVMNLILPLDRQLPTGKEFMRRYFTDNNGVATLAYIPELRSSIRGRVGYLRAMSSGLNKVVVGVIYRDMKKIPIHPTIMSDFQTLSYTAAYKSDIGDNTASVADDDIIEDTDTESTTGLYSQSRQASLAVYPDGSSGGSIDSKSQTGFGRYFTLVGSNYVLLQSFKDELTNRGKATHRQILDNISRYSSIYADTIRSIIDAPRENVFVYNKYVQGSGAILFAELLRLFGFEKTRGNIEMSGSVQDDDDNIDSEVRDERARMQAEYGLESDSDGDDDPAIVVTPKFSLITGESVTGVEIDRVVDKIFNDPRNRYGRYIRVIIGSQVIGEGKSLKNVRQIHIQTPHWNNPETEQAIGRGIRAFSHDDLPLAERYVRVYRHCSVPNNSTESINYVMYKTSEDKDFKMRQIERLCKEEAVDCMINYDRNNLVGDVDYSKECDYMKCQYQCSNIDPETRSHPQIIPDVYNLFYAGHEIESVTTVLGQMYRREFSYSLQHMISQFPHISPIIFIRALKGIIDGSHILINRYGMPNYLREESDVYFLVDDITVPNSYLISYYAENPNVKSYYNFEDIIRTSQYKYIVAEKLYILENYNSKNAGDKGLVLSQISTLDSSLQELFIEYAVIADRLKITHGSAVRAIILEYYKNYIITVGDKTVSTFLRESDDKIRCISSTSTDYSEWTDCGSEIEDQIDNERTDVITNLKLNKYGYYGLLKPRGAFPFKIVTVADDNPDHRKNKRGAVCEQIVPKSYINVVIRDINNRGGDIIPDVDVVMRSRADFISEIVNSKHNKTVTDGVNSDIYSKSDLKSLSDDKLKTVYHWIVNSNKKKMCAAIQSWFTDNNLMASDT